VLALGQRDPDSLDFYAGPPSWIAEAHAADLSLEDVRKKAAALLSDIQEPSLAAELKAVVARVEILSGRRYPFDAESRLLFGVDAGQRDRATFESVRREIDTRLPGGGDLPARYEAFEKRFIVRRDRLDDVLHRAIEECHAITRRHLVLPPHEVLSLRFVRELPWSALTQYVGHRQSIVEINTGYQLTIDRALELACHEAYPGHHTIHVLTDPRVQARYSPRALRTEGAATYAVQLAFPGDSRLRFERDVLFPVAGIPIDDIERYLAVERLVDRLRWIQVDVARRYLDGELEFVRAAEALERDALMPRSSADTMLKFFNEFRTYAVTYTVGRDLAAAAVDAAGAAGADEDKRWQAYERWIRQ
jgi:hypothetical protein